MASCPGIIGMVIVLYGCFGGRGDGDGGGTAVAPFPAPARVARDLRRAGGHYSAFVHSRLTLSNRISSSSTALTTLE